MAAPAYARAELPAAGYLAALKHAVESRSRSSWLVGGDCKAQAMTAFLLLRRRGLAATLRVGMREHPFSLHAWTSSNGVSIPDAAPGGHLFTPVLSSRGG